MLKQVLSILVMVTSVLCVQGCVSANRSWNTDMPLDQHIQVVGDHFEIGMSRKNVIVKLVKLEFQLSNDESEIRITLRSVSDGLVNNYPADVHFEFDPDDRLQCVWLESRSARLIDLQQWLSRAGIPRTLLPIKADPYRDRWLNEPGLIWSDNLPHLDGGRVLEGVAVLPAAPLLVQAMSEGGSALSP